MAKGKVYAVGFGPGGHDHMTVKAVNVIKNADIVTGYTTYVEMLKDIFPDKEYKSTPMKKEMDRCRMAVELAEEGKTVAMVSSGDSGIYGMAGILLEIRNEMKADVEIETVPGVTAASAAASVLGAPLMHDFTIISLSDLMTPYNLIMKRVDCAGQGDFIVCLYNPKSKKRIDYVEKAADILMRYRDESTPVGVVRNAGREDESHYITSLGELKDAPIDMFSIVIIGNSNTYVKDGLMITPRGYQDKYGFANFQIED
ncbi:MAG: precorrin-3B C(17)-methyltransferase [Lachnospiraceae bacterium]|nr:precorrin-3B C(17)-methyltransferase [Lachnospiraceae bacterium]